MAQGNVAPRARERAGRIMITREQRDRIIELAQTGKARRDIAVEVGVDRVSVYGVVAYARQCGTDIPRAMTGKPVRDHRPRVLVPPEVLEILRPHADRREMAVRDLAAEILTTVACSGLVTAILDDTEETPNA